MSVIREIPFVDLDVAANPKKGRQPGGVIWVGVDELAVDTRYQRDLGPRGVRRVRDIAHDFDWRKFTPIIVAKRADGKSGYLVIDGQHRAAAVRARGDIAKLPAWVIDGNLAEQAQTFLTINAESARVTPGAMWYARAAAGDLGAKALLELCQSAGVEILKHPVVAQTRKPDQTNASSAIDEARRQFGTGAAKWALVALRRAGERAKRSLLSQRLIRSVAWLRKHDATWSDQDAIVGQLVDVDVDQFEADASTNSREKGGSRQEWFMTFVREHVAKRSKVAA